MDTGVDTAPEPCDDVQTSACASQNKTCVGGFCADCLPGFGWDENGLCAPEGCPGQNCGELNRECDDTTNECGGCLPGFGLDPLGNCVAGECGPSTCVNQFCEDGFCLDCLPGFYEDADGICREPNPCAPNPCTAPNKTACSISVEDPSVAVCSCTDGSTLNDAGGCVFDPCLGDPCAGQTKSHCTFDYSPEYACVCPPGTLDIDDACVTDGCSPNPCGEAGKTTCVAGQDGSANCECDIGLSPGEDGTCEEMRVNLQGFLYSKMSQ